MVLYLYLFLLNVYTGTSFAVREVTEPMPLSFVVVVAHPCVVCWQHALIGASVLKPLFLSCVSNHLCLKPSA